MVLVFGLDVPLFELLLVFMVFLTAGIVFILIELKRLNTYLIMERQDLRRLESDIRLLEHEERKLDAEEKKLGLVAKKKPRRAARKKR